MNHKFMNVNVHVLNENLAKNAKSISTSVF